MFRRRDQMDNNKGHAVGGVDKSKLKQAHVKSGGLRMLEQQPGASRAQLSSGPGGYLPAVIVPSGGQAQLGFNKPKNVMSRQLPGVPPTTLLAPGPAGLSKEVFPAVLFTDDETSEDEAGGMEINNGRKQEIPTQNTVQEVQASTCVPGCSEDELLTSDSSSSGRQADLSVSGEGHSSSSLLTSDSSTSEDGTKDESFSPLPGNSSTPTGTHTTCK